MKMSLNGTPLQILERCGGHYRCPMGSTGNPLGPLVGYAGTYGKASKHYVGFEYVNFAKAEEHPEVVGYFARHLWEHPDTTSRGLVGSLSTAHGFIGAPEGGKTLAYELAAVAGKQYIYPEKEVLQVKSAAAREEARMVFNRHEPEPGMVYWLVEDVANNFSTTRALIALVRSFNATVGGVMCFLNRSTDVDRDFRVSDSSEDTIPVLALVRQIIPQYEQEDRKVAAEIAAGNVVWKPKNRDEWAKLAAAMKAAA